MSTKPLQKLLNQELVEAAIFRNSTILSLSGLNCAQELSMFVPLPPVVLFSTNFRIFEHIYTHTCLDGFKTQYATTVPLYLLHVHFFLSQSDLSQSDL